MGAGDPIRERGVEQRLAGLLRLPGLPGALLVVAACSAQIESLPPGPEPDPSEDDGRDDNQFAADPRDDGGGDADADGDGDGDADADGDADGDGDGDGDADGGAQAAGAGGGDGGGGAGGGGAPLDGCADAASCDQMAREVFDALNAARAAAGEGVCAGGPFAWHDDLAAVARAHSTHMAAVGALTGDDPAGGIDVRLDGAGIGWSSAGEVYGVVPGTAAETIEDWLGDAGIRAYALTCEWPWVGVGVVPAAQPRAPAWVTLTMIAP